MLLNPTKPMTRKELGVSRREYAIQKALGSIPELPDHNAIARNWGREFMKGYKKGFEEVIDEEDDAKA